MINKNQADLASQHQDPVVSEIVAKRRKYGSYGLPPPKNRQAPTIELTSLLNQTSINASVQIMTASADLKTDRSLNQTDIRTANNVALQMAIADF